MNNLAYLFLYYQKFEYDQDQFYLLWLADKSTEKIAIEKRRLKQFFRFLKSIICIVLPIQLIKEVIYLIKTVFLI
ncbi:hypothetical protein PROPEN_00801 [Proteus penneri ATCC 35198]|nr:hypothetical protein PROPEN_00801 [Proteus penneri ATCC 35198]